MRLPSTPEIEQSWERWDENQRGGYLGKLDLLRRLQMEIDGERTAAIREAAKLGVPVNEIAQASGLTVAIVRRTLR